MRPWPGSSDRRRSDRIDGRILDDPVEAFSSARRAQGRGGVPGLPALPASPAPSRTSPSGWESGRWVRRPRCCCLGPPAGTRRGSPIRGPGRNPVVRHGVSPWPGLVVGPKLLYSTNRYRPLTSPPGQGFGGCQSASSSSPGHVLFITHDPTEAFLIADGDPCARKQNRHPGGEALMTSASGQGRPMPPIWPGRTSCSGLLPVVSSRSMAPRSHRRHRCLRPGDPHHPPDGGLAPSRSPRGEPQHLADEIDHIERLGDRARIHTGLPLPLVVEVTSGAVAEMPLVEGDRVWASMKATEISVMPDEDSIPTRSARLGGLCPHSSPDRWHSWTRCVV